MYVLTHWTVRATRIRDHVVCQTPLWLEMRNYASLSKVFKFLLRYITILLQHLLPVSILWDTFDFIVLGSWCGDIKLGKLSIIFWKVPLAFLFSWIETCKTQIDSLVSLCLLVIVSINLLFLQSTVSPYWLRKSYP